MLKLRPYQQDIYQRARQSCADQYKRGKVPRVLLELSTGGGKGPIGAAIAMSAASKNKSVMFGVHRLELVEQTISTFADLGLEHEVICSGYDERRHRVQICSIPTLIRRIERYGNPDLCILDEAHHCGAKTWDRIFDAWQDTAFIGMTATPWRLDGRGMGRWFNSLISGPDAGWLIEQGFLSDYVTYVPGGNANTLVDDLEAVHIVGNEYSKAEQVSILDVGQIRGEIVRHWKEKAGGLLTVGFSVTKETSRHLAEDFIAAGIPAAHLDDQTPYTVRREQLRRFARREILVMWNVGLFDEGFDLERNSGIPGCAIECVIQARKTKSLRMHRQQLGRGLRPKPRGQKAVFLDHAGNCLELGLVDDPMEWTLDDRTKVTDEKRAPPTKMCPECFAMMRAHVRVCPYCGASVVIEGPGREVDYVPGEMIAINDTLLQARRARLVSEAERHIDEVKSAQSLEALQQIEARRKLGDGWAEMIWGQRVSD